MRILLTNDDGIHAPGLALLAEAASQFGDVFVVAPDTERSGSSHAITLFRPLRLRPTATQWFACDGTPTDCVYLALHELKLAPDVLLSGINPGPNLAHDVLYSGTVSAALEGAHWGVPAIALSHCIGDEAALAALAPILPQLLAQLLPVAATAGCALNVNLPPAHRIPYLGTRVTRLGERYYSNEVHSRNDPRGRLYYWIGGARVEMPDLPGSDCNAVRENFVSITPLADDLTRHDALAPLAAALDLATPPSSRSQRGGPGTASRLFAPAAPAAHPPVTPSEPK